MDRQGGELSGSSTVPATVTAMTRLAERFEHVSLTTVRFWATIDSGVLALATPWTASWFLQALYWFNGWLGGAASPPDFGAMQMFFVNLSGVMVAVWVIARWLHPIGLMALIDGAGRLVVAALLIAYILWTDAPPALWFFVFTETVGAVPQLRACLAAPRA